MNISIAICDDENMYISILQEKMENIDILKEHQLNIRCFTSSTELIGALNSGMKFDVIFIDIKLDHNVLGTDIGIKIKNICPEIFLIYVSSYECFFPDLAVAEPFDFLSKPFQDEKLEKTVQKLIKRLQYLKSDFTYLFKFNGSVITVNLKDVLYFESQHRIIKVYCTDNSIYQFYKKLDDVEKEIFDIYPFFIRISKSYLVNYNYCDSFNKERVIIKNITFNVTAKYKDNLLKFIKEYCTNNL